MLALVVLLLLYIIFRDLLPRTGPPARNVPKRELADPQGVNHAGHGASRVYFSDDGWPTQVAVPAKQEKVSSVHASGSSTSGKSQSRGRRQASAPSTAQPAIASGEANATVVSTVSLSSLGPSFVKKFAELKVDTMHPRLASPARASHAGPTARSTARVRTLSMSPLTTPPRSPTRSPTPSSSRTPVGSQVGSRGRPLAGQSAVDFSLYKKKIRALTKSPQKPQTKAAGKLRTEATAGVTIITTWFYKVSTNLQLLAIPPDLTGHPEGLSLGDVYFDRVGDAYQLWLWCLDKVGIPHWKEIPFGYQRDDGKRLIVTRKNHLLSWVTPSYYKQIGSGDGSSVGEGED